MEQRWAVPQEALREVLQAVALLAPALLAALPVVPCCR